MNCKVILFSAEVLFHCLFLKKIWLVFQLRSSGRIQDKDSAYKTDKKQKHKNKQGIIV